MRKVLALLLLCWGALTINIGSPWSRHGDSNGVWISETVQAGRLVPTRAEGPYTHHPPLVVWLSLAAFRAFGATELALRYVAATSTLLSVAAFYAVSRRGWSTILYAFTPMILFFGRMPDHEAPSLAILLLLALALQRRRWLAVYLLVVLASLSSWAAILIAGLLLVVGRPRALILLVLATVGWLTWYELAVPGALADLQRTFLWRASNASYRLGSDPITPLMYLRQYSVHLGLLLTPGVLLLGFVGWRVLWRRPLWMALGVGALLYVVGLRNAAYIHEYYKIYLAAPMALAGGPVIAEGLGNGWRVPVILVLALSAGLSIAILIQLHGLN